MHRIKPGYVVGKVPIFSFSNLVLLLNVSTACSRAHLRTPSAPALFLTDEQVTGVSGFLGSHVVDQLLKDGYRVRGWVIFAASRVRLAELGLQQPSELLALLKLLLSRKHSLLSLEETAWRSLGSMTLSPTTSPRLLRVSGSTVHKGVSTHRLTGASGVLHLASPLVGKLPPAEMLDVRTHSSTPPSAPAQ